MFLVALFSVVVYNFLQSSSKELNVDNILQKPELPNGCEITSLAIVLNYLNYPVDKCDLSDNYLPKIKFENIDSVLYGSNPEIAYAGDPRNTTDYYCFSQPIVIAANNYL